MITHEQLQELGKEIQKLIESKLQRAFEGEGDLRVVSAAAVMALIDYKNNGNREYLCRDDEMLALINEYLRGA